MTDVLSAIHDVVRQAAQKDLWLDQPFDGAQPEAMELLQSVAQLTQLGNVIVGNSQAMTGIDVRTDAMVDFVASITCRTETGTTTVVPMNVGGPGGSSSSLVCPADTPFVRGVHMRSAHVVDGLSLDCAR